MNTELEKLIDLALADGQLTDKEKQILTRKAKEFGVDIDEFEMVLEGKLHLAQKENAKITAPPPPQQETVTQAKSNKYGDIKKCPACGAYVSSLSTRCQDCGHNFSNIEANSSINKLFQMLNEAENTRTQSSSGIFGKLQSIFGVSDTDKKKLEIISSFPIPTTKDDMIEFLSLAMPKTKIKKGFLGLIETYDDKIPNMYAVAWKAKCEEIIMKARFSMKDDKKTLDEIEYYAKKIGVK
jgi:hypothetical protein